MIIYRNGVATVGSAKTSLPLNTANVSIGRVGDVAQYYFNGLIDEVAIFDVALSAGEIKKRYQAGRP